MKFKIISLIILGSIFLAACASSPAAVEMSSTSTEAVSMPEVTSTVEMMTEDTGSSSPAAAAVSFSQDIFPIIQEFALPAHGTQAEGGVFLETYEDIMNYVVPGDPAASELYRRLTGDGVPIMPPSGKLPDATIQLFYDWIAQGAQNN